MHHILLKKVIHRLQGILIRRRIEIQGSPEEVLRSICNKELMRRSRIASYAKIHSPYPILRLDGSLVDGGRLGSMLEGHFESIIPQLVETVLSYCLIADIDPGVESGEIYIDPIRIFSGAIEKSAVLYHIRIHRVFEGIGIAGLVESLVLVLRQVYFEIPSSFRGIVAVTGEKGAGAEPQNEQPGRGF